MINQTPNRNELCHFGIKGMHWGRVKDGINGSSSFVKGAGSVNEGIANMRNAKTSNAKTKVMSDQELMERVRRMNLEQQYATLSSAQKSRGYGYVKGALEIAGGTLAVAGSIATLAAAFKKVPVSGA